MKEDKSWESWHPSKPSIEEILNKVIEQNKDILKRLDDLEESNKVANVANYNIDPHRECSSLRRYC
jgi:hypothetical protein